MPSGGEALLLAESLSVPDFVGIMKDTQNGELKAQGKVSTKSVFPDRSSGGRVLMLLSHP